MNSFFEMTFNLLTTPPGNYLYYIVLAIFTATTLQSTYLTRRVHLDDARIKVLIAMFIVLLIQILALSSSFLGWAGVGDPRLFLPPVDRASILLMITAIFWVWAYPGQSRTADVIFAGGGVIILFFLAANLFNQSAFPPEMAFNGTVWDWLWQALTLVTVLIAVVVLTNQRPENWQPGVFFFGILLLGYILNMAIQTGEGSFSGITRLSHLIAFLLLPTLAQRFQPVEVAETPALESTPDKANSKREFMELETWLELNARQDTESFFPALTRLISHTMRADRAFVVTPSETRGQVSLQAGYQAETGETFPLSTASDALLPAITRAAFFSRAQRFDHKENHEELNQLAVTAQIPAIGSALFTPFSPQQKKWGGVLVIKSATRKSWEAEDEERLATLVRSASLVLDKIVEIGLHSQSLKNMALDLETTRRENIELQDAMKKLEVQSGYERAEPELNALLAVQQESQDFIASLQRDNRQLAKEIEDLRGQLDNSGEGGSPTSLSVEAASARERIQTLEKSTLGIERINHHVRLVDAVLRELRDPISTFNSRMDALLSAPGGQDPETEEQALKNLQASLEGIRSQIEDLDQMEILENGVGGLAVRQTDLSRIIDQAMAAARARLGQKALNLHIGLPDDLPPFFSYPGALKQALVHVLENAIEASAIGGEIELTVKEFSEPDDTAPYLLFQLTDWGGGRNMDETRQAFTRHDGKKETAGPDGGGGLFLANQLVEAHGGRMWLDKAEDGASVFSILLPLHPVNAAPSETK